MVVFGRFVIGARLFLNPLVGSVRLPFGRFLAADAVGATVWAGCFVLIGYVAGGQIGALGDIHTLATVLIAGTLVVAALTCLIKRLAFRLRRGIVSPEVGAHP